MVTYNKKIFIFNVKESWYTYKHNFWNIFSLNAFLHLKNLDNKRIFAFKKISHTLELDLTNNVETIFANFSKQIRQQIKIAENEGIICYFHQDIEKFVDFFNEFALKKDTFTTSKKNVSALGDSLKLSFAVYNGQIIAAHSYLVDAGLGIARHIHSATKRLDEQYDRNLIGRANKYLTVKDILYFKEGGYKIFDFGGYAKNTEDKSLNGINNYKLLFGGKVVTCLDYYSYHYWLLKRLSKLLGLSGKL